MLAVTEGSHGTARAAFQNFPIRVAGKTGTAQEKNAKRNDHSSFGGFAPFEDPTKLLFMFLFLLVIHNMHLFTCSSNWQKK